MFLTLDGLRLPPALASLVSVLLVAGLINLGRRLACGLGGRPDDTPAVCAGFVCATGIVGALVHAAALSGVLQVGWLRILGGAIVGCGAIEVVQRARDLRARVTRTMAGLASRAGVEVASLAIAASILTLTAGASLGPPTDIDSLNYHLGVPLEWIRQSGAVALPEWLHARLLGIGDMLPLLGLAMGTDTVGAALQAAGLIAAGTAIASVAASPGARALAWLLVAASPQAVTLTMTQKPQMLPAVAVVLAMVVVADRRSPLTFGRVWLVSGALMFAAGSKYTFLLSGVVVAVALMATSRSQGQLGRALLALAVCAIVLPAPVHARNLWFYGDPLSPFLEARRADADPVVVAFADHLSSIGSSRSPGDVARLPFRLIGTRSPGGLPTVLGLGLLATLFVTLRRTTGQLIDARLLVTASVAMSLLILAAGRLSPRDFMEVYLLLAGAAVAAPRAGVVAQLWQLALVAQAAVTLGLVAYGAVRTLPGAVSESARHGYMTEAADEYAAARWFAGAVPENATVMAELRAAALFERPFVSWEYARFLAMTSLPDAEKDARLRRLAACSAVTHVVMRSPATESALEAIGNERVPVVGGPEAFRWTARNPWSRGGGYNLVVREFADACP